jgi:putative hemolysin
MEIFILLTLILINGIFSMSEIALVSARKNRLSFAAKKGDTGAKAAIRLQETPSKLLSTVQIGITLVGLLTGIYSGETITEDMSAWLMQFPVLAPYADTLGLIVVLVIITFFSLVLGELVPKRVGLTYPESIAKVVAVPMQVIGTIAAPFVWLLTHTTELVLRLFPGREAGESKVTEEEIKAIVKEGREGGEIQQIEQEIVNRVFSVGDRSVSSLMTSRRKMTSISLDDSVDEIRKTVLEDMHSFYPVYDPESQDIIGVVALKRLFTVLHQGGFNLQSLMGEPHYIAETSSAYQALELFKTTKNRYALVIDEFGSVQGIITISDILEALVGDVSEFYAEEFMFQQRDETSWLVDGQYPIVDFLSRFELDEYAKDFEVNTLGGLVITELGRLPKTGERLNWSVFEFEVVDMDGPTIDKILVTKIA